MSLPDSPKKVNGNPYVDGIMRIARGEGDHALIRALRDRGCNPQRKGAGKYLANCPHREDKHPSLQITIEDDDSVKLFDGAGALRGRELKEAVCKALGLPVDCLKSTKQKRPKSGLTWVTVEKHKPCDIPQGLCVAGLRYIAHYQYTRSDGSVAYETVRVEDVEGKKSFQTRRQIAEGEWVYEAGACCWGDGNDEWLPAIKHEPYQRSRIEGAAADAMIYVVEGEKDVDTAYRLGLFATTTPHGANSPGLVIEALCEMLADRDVAIIPDNDPAGAKYADFLAGRLVKVCRSVRRCAPLDASVPKGDLTDFIEDGGTREQVEQHVSATQPLPKPQKESEPDPYATHLGFAKTFAARRRGELVYCFQTKRWVWFNGMRWVDDQRPQARRLFYQQSEVYRQQAEECARFGDRDGARNATKIADQLQQMGTINASMEAASDLLETSADNFDTHPFLFNVLNGTLDLRTGLLRPHDPSDFITKLAPVVYDPDAKCPLFERCMEEWSCGRPEWVRFVQQWSGYNLSGDNSEPLLPVYYGAGGNGKSAFLDATGEVIGDYGGIAPLGMLSESASERHQCEIMALAGKRRVISSEGKPGAPIREDFVRSITGDKSLTGRWMFSNPVTFERTFKLTHITNHMPRITAVDDAIRRRVLKVEWGYRVERPDPRLFDKLKEELPGILAWMVRGFRDWNENGFVIPTFIRSDTDEYLTDENPVAQFVTECCDVSDSVAKVRATDLYQCYEVWCESNGYSVLGRVNFAKTIRLNVPATVKKGTVDFGNKLKAEGWTGIRLRADAPRPREPRF